MNHNLRYEARLVIEAAAPLGIGTGRSGLHTDRQVARDAYGYPYLPGTSLAGVLRSSLDAAHGKVRTNDLFGYQDKDRGQGSRVTCSSGHLLGAEGRVVGEDGHLPDENDEYLRTYLEGWLPERDHVRINHRGVADAEGHGKFDEQLVPKGARFVFQLSLEGTGPDDEHWASLLETVHEPGFRLGGGTRKGFGKFIVREVRHRAYDLTNEDDLSAYLNLNSSLNTTFGTVYSPSQAPATVQNNAKWVQYKLQLVARDYLMFGQGIGNAKVNQLPKREVVVAWQDGQPTVQRGKSAPYLIPATSIKGALRHRTAFYYNKRCKRYIEEHEQLAPPVLDAVQVVAEVLAATKSLSDYNIESLNTEEEISEAKSRYANPKALVDSLDLVKSETYRNYVVDLKESRADHRRPGLDENNEAIRTLFGYAIERDGKDSARRGSVIIDDLYLPASEVGEKDFSHVMIDRFTGGSKRGALFNERVIQPRKPLSITILVESAALRDEWIKEAFELALQDLTTGRLALGGNTAKGHGIFSGTINK